MPRKYHKETFDKISGEKRERLLAVATSEFAAKGFAGTNINHIASRARISIGSLYRYFASKEDLFLTVLDQGYQALDRILWEIIAAEGDLFEKIEKILRAAQSYSRDHPAIIQIYLGSTGEEGLAHLSKELSQKIESIAANYYRSLIASARTTGMVAPDVDERVAAFCLDSLFLILQFSYAYYRERIKIFAGENALDEDEHIIAGMMQFIRRALS